MLIFSAYTFMLLPFCFLFVFSVFTVAFLHTPCYVFVHFVSFHFYFEVTQQRSWSFCLSLNFFLHMSFRSRCTITHLVFHIPTASCWLTVCLSVVQILIVHVCFFFPTHTSCIQRLYKGQFKILQSYFVFIIKCHWRRNTKYSTLFVYMFTYGR